MLPSVRNAILKYALQFKGCLREVKGTKLKAGGVMWGQLGSRWTKSGQKGSVWIRWSQVGSIEQYGEMLHVWVGKRMGKRLI